MRILERSKEKGMMISFVRIKKKYVQIIWKGRK
jgi:hypothetical protein